MARIWLCHPIMENTLRNPGTGDSATLDTLNRALAVATWEVGLPIPGAPLPTGADISIGGTVGPFTPVSPDEWAGYIAHREEKARAKQDWNDAIDATIAAIDSLLSEGV